MSPSEVNVSFIEQEKQCTNATKIVQSQYALAENRKNVNFYPGNSNYTAILVNDNKELIINCSSNANNNKGNSNKTKTIVGVSVGVAILICIIGVVIVLVCVRKMNRSSMDASSLIEDPVDN